MSECRQFESLLPTFVDGEASEQTRRAVEGHLRVCTSCREAVAEERACRDLLRSRAPRLQTPAPPGLRTRLLAVARDEARTPERLGWAGRLAAFAAAAAVVLAVSAGTLSVVTSSSNVVFAAQLALDHIKCFWLDGHEHLTGVTHEHAERQIAALYGWDLDVPAESAAGDLRIVGVRRCLLGDGNAAHVLYRYRNTPVSLFMVPETTRAADEVVAFGQQSRMWTRDGVTYVLVAPAGNPALFSDVARHMENGAQ